MPTKKEKGKGGKDVRGDGERKGERGKTCKLIRYSTVCFGELRDGSGDKSNGHTP